MKTLALFLFSVAALFAADGDVDFPNELTLTNGAVLRQTHVEDWGKDNVLIRYTGGPVRLRFSQLSPDSLARVLAVKSAIEKPHKITGTVYVVTRGSGAYKFARTVVFAFPIESLEDAKRAHGAFDRPPLATATTDADGHFSMTLPDSKPAFLFCIASRLVAGDQEINRWAVPIAGDLVDLSDRNSL